MKKTRKPQKAKDRFITTASGHKEYSGYGTHADRRTKRNRSRSEQRRRAIAEYL